MTKKFTHIYVMEYDNGTCKVGATGSLRSRQERLRTVGSGFGVRALRFWASPPLVDAAEAEQALLAALGTPAFGKETFRIKFEEAVAVAEQLGTAADPNAAKETALAEFERIVALPEGPERTLAMDAAMRAKGHLGRITRDYITLVAILEGAHV